MIQWKEQVNGDYVATVELIGQRIGLRIIDNGVYCWLEIKSNRGNRGVSAMSVDDAKRRAEGLLPVILQEYANGPAR